jgi:hypothetical protein
VQCGTAGGRQARRAAEIGLSLRSSCRGPGPGSARGSSSARRADTPLAEHDQIVPPRCCSARPSEKGPGRRPPRRSGTPRPASLCVGAEGWDTGSGARPLTPGALRAARVPVYRSLWQPGPCAVAPREAGRGGGTARRADPAAAAGRGGAGRALRSEATAGRGRPRAVQATGGGCATTSAATPAPRCRAYTEPLQADAPVIRHGVRLSPALLGRDDIAAVVTAAHVPGHVDRVRRPGPTRLRTRSAARRSSASRLVELAGVAARRRHGRGRGRARRRGRRQRLARSGGARRAALPRSWPGPGPGPALVLDNCGTRGAGAADPVRPGVAERTCACSPPAAPRSACRRSRCTCRPSSPGRPGSRSGRAARPDADPPAEAVE